LTARPYAAFGAHMGHSQQNSAPISADRCHVRGGGATGAVLRRLRCVEAGPAGLMGTASSSKSFSGPTAEFLMRL